MCFVTLTWMFWLNLLLLWMSLNRQKINTYSGDIADLCLWYKFQNTPILLGKSFTWISLFPQSKTTSKLHFCFISLQYTCWFFLLCNRGWGKCSNAKCLNCWKIHLQVKILNLDIFSHAPHQNTAPDFYH